MHALSAALLLVACDNPAPTGAPVDAPALVAVDAAPPISLCSGGLTSDQRASAIERVSEWSASPALPDAVGGYDECDFYAFAWRSFLALTEEKAGARTFQSWGNAHDLFPASGAPAAWPDGPRDVPADELIQAAAVVPLVDQRGELVHYSVYTNQAEYDYVRCCGTWTSECYDAKGGAVDGHLNDPDASFPMPPGPDGGWGDSVELKTAWRVLETCPEGSPADCTPEDTSGYVTATGDYNPVRSEATWDDQTVRGATLGLVGFHIVTKNPENPGWIWATFERRRNAPDCDGDRSGEWTFYDSGCEGDHCADNSFCTPCPLSIDQWATAGADGYTNLADKSTGETTQTRARRQACPASEGATPQALLVDAAGQPIAPECASLCPDGVTAPTGDPATCAVGEPAPTMTNYAGASLSCTNHPDSFKLSAPKIYDADRCSDAPIPTQVCRKAAAAIPPGVAALNELVRASLGDDALANYELIGVMWLDDQGAEKGTLRLSNTTMEAFEQALDLSAIGAGTGCLVCHADQFISNPRPSEYYAEGLNDRSFLFMRIEQNEISGPLTCPEVPDPEGACAEWIDRCPEDKLTVAPG